MRKVGYGLLGLALIGINIPFAAAQAQIEVYNVTERVQPAPIEYRGSINTAMDNRDTAAYPPEEVMPAPTPRDRLVLRQLDRSDAVQQAPNAPAPEESDISTRELKEFQPEGPPSILEPTEKNDILYVTGGVGKEENEALAAVSSQFNLRVVSSLTGGAYVFGTNVSIYDAQGGLTFETTLGGPYLYVQLPPGKYRVEAKQNDQVQKKEAVIKNAAPQQTVHFTW